MLAGVARFTGTGIIVDLVGTLAVIATRLASALVDVDLASWTSPAWMTDALVVEELVHANAVQARIARAKVDLLMTTFSSEARWAVTCEVIYQIGTVSSQKTGTFSTIVGIDFATLSFPTRQTFALVTALLQRNTACSVVARIAVRGARINL